jgi:hypothetical protein
MATCGGPETALGGSFRLSNHTTESATRHGKAALSYGFLTMLLGELTIPIPLSEPCPMSTSRMHL